MGMVFPFVCLFGLLGWVHSVVLPARIEKVRRIRAKMPTLQVATLEHVASLERWRSLIRFAMVVELLLFLVMVST